MQWLLQVNQALDHGRLKLRCQKIAPIDPGKGFSPHYEVLLGVTDESGESLHIGNFISAAEKFNRMAQVDRWVVSTAISWIAEQKTHLAGLGGFAINLSGHTLGDEGFIAFVDELFQKTRVPSGYINFEVTETVAIANLERASRIIHALKDLGCTFALDDFGSGLSSYSYLKALPVDYLKIDGAFVKDMHADRNNYAVVKSINEIAHFMGKRTIAEYVENTEILRCLEEIGVDYAQGYGIEKPRLLDELTQGS
jgi:EAL domain-containing protein (putative c-di-GMP-specific phosphodiesterase class I)